MVVRMTNALQSAATEIRKHIVRMHRKGTSVGCALSIADILTVLYFDVMQIEAPNDPDRDRFVLSKGHAASALYAALAEKGFLDRAMLDGYLSEGSPLTGHPSRGAVPGVEISTGSLGHGLPIAAGMALAAKQDGRKHRVFVLMGDGEIQEGSVWAGAMLAARFGLDNLVAIVDANGWQGYGRVDDIMPLASFIPKWRAFGWETEEVDGHDLDAISNTLQKTPFRDGCPSVLIAHTVQGKGIAEMEDTLGWHYFSVPEAKVQPFVDELNGRESKAES